MRTDSTTTSIDISWEPPTDNGGCQLTGYAVYVSDGSGGFVEANADDDAAVRD